MKERLKKWTTSVFGKLRQGEIPFMENDNDGLMAELLPNAVLGMRTSKQIESSATNSMMAVYNILLLEHSEGVRRKQLAKSTGLRENSVPATHLGNMKLSLESLGQKLADRPDLVSRYTEAFGERDDLDRRYKLLGGIVHELIDSLPDDRIPPTQ